jgi:hypothetical protein
MQPPHDSGSTWLHKNTRPLWGVDMSATKHEGVIQNELKESGSEGQQRANGTLENPNVRVGRFALFTWRLWVKTWRWPHICISPPTRSPPASVVYRESSMTPRPAERWGGEFLQAPGCHTTAACDDGDR